MATRSLSRNAPAGASPFAVAAQPLAREKFADPFVTAKGEPRASVALRQMETLWFATGTLCNLACANCYIESSPTNDALVYLSADEVSRFLDEVDAGPPRLRPREIGFTGGEPFMNPDIIAMVEDAVKRGFDVLVLSNALKPMRRHEAALLRLREAYGEALTIRVSIDHYTQAFHEAERGPNSWTPMLEGLRWLSANGFSIAAAGRSLAGETQEQARLAYGALFKREGIAIDTANPAQLVLFPEMDAKADVPEITTACWDILGTSPDAQMCASSRMVVHRKGEDTARVVACTLLPYDPQFDMGGTVAEADREVMLNHPHCARFCVLGGASCSA
ncbi:radical SAM protein [Erythrobacter sp. EC-HK427]|uniref:radical SAM protein n=1 Tax=Erythrobacter sp. EC-HK427 TaxID=2038396 RepID=UPI0012515B94|nr:radical SAM protein [Erythrobacter sp. EC-HK427]VVS99160.1 Radical SAM protein [Erythrobacter sp. EC-HK427]